MNYKAQVIGENIKLKKRVRLFKKRSGYVKRRT